MCGRSSLTKTEKEIEERFNATFYSEDLERYNPIPNFNVAPTQRMPVITSDNPTKLQLFRWGLIPSWAKDTKIGFSLINARLETISEKPMFKSRLSRGRCIVPMDGFYEWKMQDGVKIPYRIVTTDQDIFSVAGLWDAWLDNTSGMLLYTFTVITRSPNTLMENIHDRMPAILTPENESLWLDNHLKPSDTLDLLQPYPSEYMYAYPVSTEVNNVRNNNANLIEAV
ncbi:MAG: SOS response-associated peptidase [Lewinellaceae bacterium]|nr:SOS response-associated peptidase [Lewinellaceae bacterium]